MKASPEYLQYCYIWKWIWISPGDKRHQTSAFWVICSYHVTPFENRVPAHCCVIYSPVLCSDMNQMIECQYCSSSNVRQDGRLCWNSTKHYRKGTWGSVHLESREIFFNSYFRLTPKKASVFNCESQQKSKETSKLRIIEPLWGESTTKGQQCGKWSVSMRQAWITIQLWEYLLSDVHTVDMNGADNATICTAMHNVPGTIMWTNSFMKTYINDCMFQ